MTVEGQSPREIAREAGEVYFTTGKPCANGHRSRRLVSNGVCDECNLEKQHIRRHGSLDGYDIVRERRRERDLAKQNGTLDEYNRARRERTRLASRARAAEQKRQTGEAADIARITGFLRSRSATKRAELRAAIVGLGKGEEFEIAELIRVNTKFLKALHVEKLQAIRAGVVPQ